MRVFLHLMVVGVGAAMIFNAGSSGASNSPSPSSQDSAITHDQPSVDSDLSPLTQTTEGKTHKDLTSVTSPVSVPTVTTHPQTSVDFSEFSSLKLNSSKEKGNPLSVTSYGQKLTSPLTKFSPDQGTPTTGFFPQFSAKTPHHKSGVKLPQEDTSSIPPTVIPVSAPTSSLNPLFSDLSLTNSLLKSQKSGASLDLKEQNISPSVVQGVKRLTDIAQNPPNTTSQPLQSFPPIPPNGTLQTNPPNFLTPSPNPLSFPTTKEEVTIEGTQPITLQQAVDLARRNNETLQIAYLQWEQTKAALREQQAAQYPDLSLQMNYSRNVSPQGTLSNRAVNRQAVSQGRSTIDGVFGQNSLNSTLQLSYDVDLFGRISSTIRASSEQVRLRELEVEKISEDLRLNVTTSYYNLQDADGRVAIGEAAVRNAQKSLEDAEALERAGVGTRFAVLQAQVNLANEQQRLNEARRDQKIARRRLTEILNVNGSIELLAADPVEQAGVWKYSLEDSIILGLKNRAELEQQLVQRDLNNASLKAALAGQYPRLSLSAGYSVLGLDPDSGDPYVARGWADGYSVAAQLTWNFFDGGASKARAKQREIDIALAESRFSQLSSQIRREIEQAYFELDSSFESIGTAEKGLEQSKEALRLARLRFQAGVGTQTDVINAETDLTRAQRNLLLAIIGYNRALSSLQRAVSNLPDANLADGPRR